MRKGDWQYAEDAQIVAASLGYSDPTKAVVHLYQKRGWSASQIGRAFSKSGNCILHRLELLGIPRRGRGGDPYKWPNKRGIRRA